MAEPPPRLSPEPQQEEQDPQDPVPLLMPVQNPEDPVGLQTQQLRDLPVDVLEKAHLTWQQMTGARLTEILQAQQMKMAAQQQQVEQQRVSPPQIAAQPALIPQQNYPHPQEQKKVWNQPRTLKLSTAQQLQKELELQRAEKKQQALWLQNTKKQLEQQRTQEQAPLAQMPQPLPQQKKRTRKQQAAQDRQKALEIQFSQEELSAMWAQYAQLWGLEPAQLATLQLQMLQNAQQLSPLGLQGAHGPLQQNPPSPAQMPQLGQFKTEPQEAQELVEAPPTRRGRGRPRGRGGARRGNARGGKARATGGDLHYDDHQPVTIKLEEDNQAWQEFEEEQLANLQLQLIQEQHPPLGLLGAHSPLQQNPLSPAQMPQLDQFMAEPQGTQELVEAPPTRRGRGRPRGRGGSRGRGGRRGGTARATGGDLHLDDPPPARDHQLKEASQVWREFEEELERRTRLNPHDAQVQLAHFMLERGLRNKFLEITNTQNVPSYSDPKEAKVFSEKLMPKIKTEIIAQGGSELEENNQALREFEEGLERRILSNPHDIRVEISLLERKKGLPYSDFLKEQLEKKQKLKIKTEIIARGGSPRPDRWGPDPNTWIYEPRVLVDAFGEALIGVEPTSRAKLAAIHNKMVERAKERGMRGFGAIRRTLWHYTVKDEELFERMRNVAASVLSLPLDELLAQVLPTIDEPTEDIYGELEFPVVNLPVEQPNPLQHLADVAAIFEESPDTTMEEEDLLELQHAASPMFYPPSPMSPTMDSEDSYMDCDSPEAEPMDLEQDENPGQQEMPPFDIESLAGPVDAPEPVKEPIEQPQYVPASIFDYLRFSTDTSGSIVEVPPVVHDSSVDDGNKKSTKRAAGTEDQLPSKRVKLGESEPATSEATPPTPDATAPVPMAQEPDTEVVGDAADAPHPVPAPAFNRQEILTQLRDGLNGLPREIQQGYATFLQDLYRGVRDGDHNGLQTIQDQIRKMGGAA